MAYRSGIANLPLHWGKAPRWLFERMSRLAREIAVAIVDEYGPAELLKRISDPYWFQALGCVLGYDWHSSGITTVVCGALKDGLKDIQYDLGFFVAGGKGSVSRKTPEEILHIGDRINRNCESLVYASRIVAKVDNTALQDGYQIYHHTFFFTKDAEWAVVQQGMNLQNSYARRYHWLGEQVKDFVCEPHYAICSQAKADVLNLVAFESELSRQTITQIAKEIQPDKIVMELNKIKNLTLPARHYICTDDINPVRLYRSFVNAYDSQPQNFEKLLVLEGIGPKTVRALSLIADLLYGVKTSIRDPALYSFAHGGKDGIPFPVERKVYDRSIEILHDAVERARLGDKEKIMALKRLASWA